MSEQERAKSINSKPLKMFTVHTVNSTTHMLPSVRILKFPVVCQRENSQSCPSSTKCFTT